MTQRRARCFDGFYVKGNAMWTIVRTKRIKLSSRQRRNVEEFLQRVFHREQGRIANLVVQVRRGNSGHAEAGFLCRIRIWSHFLGAITVEEVGDTLRTAVQQASLRIREVLRRRLHKRHKRFRVGDVRNAYFDGAEL